MEHERRQPLSDEDIDRIAQAVASKAKEAFHIEEEKHYNDHQRLDRLLTAYEEATGMIRKAFYGLVIIGTIALAGVGIVKGMK